MSGDHELRHVVALVNGEQGEGLARVRSGSGVQRSEVVVKGTQGTSHNSGF